MTLSDFYLDFHCHPAMKPYGKSYRHRKTKGINSSDRRDDNSIWHYDPPTAVDELLNVATGLTKFTQSDFSTLNYGRVHVIGAALYPLEKPFVYPPGMGKGLVVDELANFVTGIGKKRIDYIQGLNDYFRDLNGERLFYEMLNNQLVGIEGAQAKYVMVNNMSDIKNALKTYQADPAHQPVPLCVLFSIEGGHVFNCAPYIKNPLTQQDAVLALVDQVKQWKFKPFYLTLAHHYYNNLCGHSPSLTPQLEKLSSQKKGMRTGITPLGKAVIRRLLDNSKGQRILIDLKHMSPLSRRQYFAMLDKEFAGENIPLIASHAACNGYRAMDRHQVDIQSTAGQLKGSDINFFDEEIVRIARSNGLICLQLDERRIASAAALKAAQGHVMTSEVHYQRARLLWHQMQHIAEVLDGAGLFAWGTQAIGSDFDGIIDPLNGFWTAEDFPALEAALTKHAYNYMNSNGLSQPFNRISSQEMVSRVMHDNGWAFLEKHFN